MLSCEWVQPRNPPPAIASMGDHVPPLQREVRVREWEELGSHCRCNCHLSAMAVGGGGGGLGGPI
jgi:hypothetical protein